MPNPGTTTQRGYGSTHQRQRRQWAPKVATGTITCPRCNTPITPNQTWDLGHQTDRNAPTHPEHSGRECPAGGNRATNRRQWARKPQPHPGLKPT
ncbi:hypothetical protein SAMN04488581_2616 [Mycolicibacterium neoaurum]|nr:hypothetical protein SAMN04488581_2616 [Mycolicibacterium neoaurum]